MIETLYATDALNSAAGFGLAALVGFFFGVALERAGLASSRKIAAVFYFRDMTVLKVMFTAIVVATIGLAYLFQLGWLKPDSLFFLDTVYGAHIVGGLLVGIGMVMGGWCPGTATAGLGSGRIDALIFLVGVIGGSILFNEVFPWIKPLYEYKASGIVSAPGEFGLPTPIFVLGLTVFAVILFWICEIIEQVRQMRVHQLPHYVDYLAGRAAPSEPLGVGMRGRTLLQTGYYRVSLIFLILFSIALVAAAAGLLFVQPANVAQLRAQGWRPLGLGIFDRRGGDQRLLEAINQGADHIEPAGLAQRIMAGEPGLYVVDLRTPDEFQAFHIRGAVNIPPQDLPKHLKPYKDQGTIVLYSNGMTHPGQAAIVLRRHGYNNVYILTDGLDGFINQCLKPASLRPYPVTDEQAQQIRECRAYFLEGEAAGTPSGVAPAEWAAREPGLVDTQWLQDNLGRPGLAVIDVRPQPEYNTSHIPGAFSLAVDNLRGNTGGIPSVLLPPDQLAARFGAMGITPGTMVVLAYGERAHDATLPTVALDALGHKPFAVLDGGFAKWTFEQRPVSGELPSASGATYRPVPGANRFIIGADDVFERAKAGAVIIDVRPAEYYRGEKSDEPRAGHIPGAINRPYTEDTVDAGGYLVFKPAAELEQAYAALIPSKTTNAAAGMPRHVIVHCRTGHQASQTFFILRHLLGYTNLLFYDAGWTEWAARPDLPVQK